MQIPLTAGVSVVIDDSDYSLVSSYSWHAVWHRHTWYAVANVQRNDGTKDKRGRSRRTTIQMHRLILGAKTGEQVDHEDGNGLNNQRSNIAIVTHSQNQQNQHAVRSRTGAMGVSETRSGKFQATIKRNGKTIALGTYPSILAASVARSSFSS